MMLRAQAVQQKDRPACISNMTSEKTVAHRRKRILICLPTKFREGLSLHYKLDHGLFITGLNPHINEGYLQAYFKDWGRVTLCQFKNGSSSGGERSAFVRFATENEADMADWCGPHYIGGDDVKVRRVVSPKITDEPEEEIKAAPAKAPPRRSMGLGYILEDPQWLEEENDA